MMVRRKQKTKTKNSGLKVNITDNNILYTRALCNTNVYKYVALGC